MTPSEKFRYFRAAKGLTQRQLALALGITARSVRYIEAGKREPRIKTQMKFEVLVDKHLIEESATKGIWIHKGVIECLMRDQHPCP